jgi:hypothetical protein
VVGRRRVAQQGGEEDLLERGQHRGNLDRADRVLGRLVIEHQQHSRRVYPWLSRGDLAGHEPDVREPLIESCATGSV